MAHQYPCTGQNGKPRGLVPLNYICEDAAIVGLSLTLRMTSTAVDQEEEAALMVPFL